MAAAKPVKLMQGLSDESKSRWRIYSTAKGRRIAIAHYVRRGWCYIVGWKDTQGFGLEVLWRAGWQDEGCRHPVINLR